MKKTLICLCLVLSAALFVSCGETGDTGPTGAAGSMGLYTVLQQGLLPGTSYAGCADARFSNPSPYVNRGSETYYLVGSSGTDSAYRAAVRFDIYSDIPAGSTITKAELELYCYSITGSGHITAPYEISRQWTVDTCSWVSATAAVIWSTSGGDYLIPPAGGSTTITAIDAWYKWTLDTDMVQQWLDNPVENYGVLLKEYNEDFTGYASFRSSDYAQTQYRPKLKIYYTLP